MIKTLGYFVINKLLELWHIVLKPFAYCALIAVVSVVGLCIIGHVVIALIDGIGVHDTAYTLAISMWATDTPFIFRGLLVGCASSFLFGIAWCIYDAPIKPFIKSNWELAKKRQFYKHK